VEYGIKLKLVVRRWGVKRVDWIQLAQIRVEWRGLENTVVKI
jgi:hypothetical protein